MKRTLQRQRQIQGGIDINVKTTQNISKIKQAFSMVVIVVDKFFVKLEKRGRRRLPDSRNISPEDVLNNFNQIEKKEFVFETKVGFLSNPICIFDSHLGDLQHVELIIKSLF